jgi:hypothetical protein
MSTNRKLVHAISPYSRRWVERAFSRNSSPAHQSALQRQIWSEPLTSPLHISRDKFDESDGLGINFTHGLHILVVPVERKGHRALVCISKMCNEIGSRMFVLLYEFIRVRPVCLSDAVLGSLRSMSPHAIKSRPFDQRGKEGVWVLTTNAYRIEVQLPPSYLGLVHVLQVRQKNKGCKEDLKPAVARAILDLLLHSPKDVILPLDHSDDHECIKLMIKDRWHRTLSIVY